MAKDQLKEFITNAAMTQAAFAELAALHDVDVSRIIRGERLPTLEQAAKIERVTKIPASAWVSEAA